MSHPALTPQRSLLRSTALALLSGALLCAAALAPVRADKGLSEGTYRDRDGKSQGWSISKSHLLTWNGQPYAPAGVVFRSEYLNAPTPENLQKDGAELDGIKAAGVLDLWIDPQRGLLENSPEQVQALIDAVESRGFRYGLRVGDRFREPLVGFSPSLAHQRVPASELKPGGRGLWKVSAPQAKRIVYALAEVSSLSEQDDRQQNWTIVSGEALVERDIATVDAALPRISRLGKTRALLMTVPEIQVEPEDLGSFGDLWAGMERYSGRLKKHLQALKFGPGFRFLLDPFSAGDGNQGREDMVFPSSRAFQDEFRDWLKKRGGILTLNTRWRTTDKRIAGFEEAGRLVPMWGRNDPPEGDGWLIDPVEKQTYRVKPAECKIWSDLDDFRAESLKKWMNTIPTALKQEGLDVPVVFSWSAYHPLFINSPAPFGYDGLAAQLSGDPASLAREAPYALSQVEEADRHSWLIAARLTGPRAEDGNPQPAADARKSWEVLRDAGFRGVYLDPKVDPNALTLAKDLSASIAADGAALAQPLKVIFFPMPLATAGRAAKLSNGVWWLPSGASARLLRYGDAILGYEIDEPLGEDSKIRKGTVLWSGNGKQDLSFFVGDRATLADWYDSAGQPLKVKANKKKKTVSVPVSEEPIIATGVEAVRLFPIELAQTQLREFDALLREAEAQRLNSSQLRVIYKQAESALAPNSAPSIYEYITPHVNMLREELRPYVWIEGERPVTHNFSGTVFQAGCSGGMYLKLDRAQAPTSGVYRARYAIELRRDASYELWVGGRLPGSAGTSPLIWQIDEEPAVEVNSAMMTGESYSPGMGWYSLGRLTLKAGRHELALVIPEKTAGASPRFAAAVDAVLLTRDAFTPNGVEKPYAIKRSGK
jgi:hypothetical protein